MSISIDTPQVAALRAKIEKTAGEMSSHSRFNALSEMVEEKCKEHISVTTLERIWGYSTRNARNVSVRILDILAQFADARDWNEFRNRAYNGEGKDSGFFDTPDTIRSCNLEKGTLLRITWLPDRVCEAEYIGENRFIARRCENTSIMPGDSFLCLQFRKGRELYMECFTRDGEEYGSSTACYVVGQTNGLTSVEVIGIV